MPDGRLAEARKTLPVGYQFGDAIKLGPGHPLYPQWLRDYDAAIAKRVYGERHDEPGYGAGV